MSFTKLNKPSMHNDSNEANSDEYNKINIIDSENNLVSSNVSIY